MSKLRGNQQNKLQKCQGYGQQANPEYPGLTGMDTGAMMTKGHVGPGQRALWESHPHLSKSCSGQCCAQAAACSAESRKAVLVVSIRRTWQ